MKTRRTCRGCGRLFWSKEIKVHGKLDDPTQYIYCQKCRNKRSREEPMIREVKDSLKEDVDALIWLENTRPDLADRLRSKKPLNKAVGLSKASVVSG